MNNSMEYIHVELMFTAPVKSRDTAIELLDVPLAELPHRGVPAPADLAR